MKAIEILKVLCFRPPIFLAVGLLACVACNTPGFVDGVVQQEGFFVRDAAPAARWSKERLVVVLSEEDGETLRVVSLHLPDAEDLPFDTPIALEGVAGPYLEVAWGALEVFHRADGARILSTTDTRFDRAVSGDLVLRRVAGELEGSFSVRLVDGGFLEGGFLVDATR